jgi:hypothetical protein
LVAYLLVKVVIRDGWPRNAEVISWPIPTTPEQILDRYKQLYGKDDPYLKVYWAAGYSGKNLQRIRAQPAKERLWRAVSIIASSRGRAD